MFMMVNKQSPLTILSRLIDIDDETHMREITRKTGLSLGFVSRILNELSKQNLILLHKKGRMKFYRVNTMNPLIKQFKILMTIYSIMPTIKTLKKRVRRIILFGSSARGENVPESDIDLFVLTNDPLFAKKYISKNRKIAPIIMNSNEFMTLKKKDFALYDQITRGITVFDHE